MLDDALEHRRGEQPRQARRRDERVEQPDRPRLFRAEREVEPDRGGRDAGRGGGMAVDPAAPALRDGLAERVL